MTQRHLKFIHITKNLTNATKKNKITKPFKIKDFKMTTNAIYYDTEIRQQAGLSSAVIYSRIKYWCSRNALNKKNIKNGIAYCYQSYFQLAQATGYSVATVKRCLRKLLLLGLIFKREKYKKTEINHFSIIDESEVQSFRLPESNPVQPENTENKKENTQLENKKQSTQPPQMPQHANDWKEMKGDNFFSAIHKIINKSKNFRQRDLNI